MLESVKEEVQDLIKKLKLNCSIEEFKDKVYWSNINIYQKLSKEFIREFKDKVDWYYISRFQKLSEDFIREFKDKVKWYNISQFQILSESFIREFKDKIDWYYISYYQKLSEEFIREFKDKVKWYDISQFQILSEDFIREFKNKVDWYYISKYQKLSENFIRKFKNKVNWENISIHQTLSKKFINEFKDKIDIDLYNEVHQKKSREVKIKEMEIYAEKHNLKFDGRYLHAFRNHNKFGRGSFNKTIFYKKGKYYKDWKCDMRENKLNSFGLGIWPVGNTPVKVSVNDWGISIKDNNNGKARVWGFTVL